ncbi:aldo/keto reductase [Arthrobacter sp. ISL-48]|uniref:aldo/keto reductase n=1 Tax=Arthrobacter sp. ISL-48 TaxID=2819110 RepID=UPI001BE78EA2|nr:aldo/keto reductase [Arthrobacter sp. ISL-48]MBT2532993.1 aldo/keto reductase [Arthrobacter sp. ISL-48]
MTVMTRRLGRSDLQVSALGLGCWAIGGAMAAGDQQLGYAGVDDDLAVQGLHRAVELGITLFDTADAYGAGHSERLLGTVLADHPDVLVATKFGNTIDESTRQLTGIDTSPAYVRQALHASLRRLGRDRIDLYQLHTPDVDDARAAELVNTLEELATEGLIRWYGISTDDPGRAEIFAAGPRCTAVQLQLNVLDENPEMLAVCERHDLAALCRSPLAMGLLGGQYTSTSRLPADDIRGRQPEWLRWFIDGSPAPDFLERLEAVRHILTADGRTPAQGALAWIWAHHPQTVPLPGFRNPAQVAENAGALDHGPLSRSQHRDVETILDRLPAGV